MEVDLRNVVYKEKKVKQIPREKQNEREYD